MRRKIMTAVLAAFMVLGLSGCQKESAAAVQAQNQETGSSQAETEAETVEPAPSENASQAEAPADGANALIVYFSWSGNTESVAKEIQAQTGADLLRLFRQSPIRRITMPSWKSHRKSRRATPVLLSPGKWRILRNMTWFTLGILKWSMVFFVYSVY